MAIIEAKNIHRKFGKGDLTAHVLKGIDVSIEEGEFIGIMGKSGAGKSTLMYQLSVLDRPTEGSLVINGTDIMELADRFGIPLITFVDTAGAYPGIGAEERGQAEAIARSTEACLNLRVPMVSVVIGEGGSGGAIAIAAANRVLMLEHSTMQIYQ